MNAIDRSSECAVAQVSSISGSRAILCSFDTVKKNHTVWAFILSNWYTLKLKNINHIQKINDEWKSTDNEESRELPIYNNWSSNVFSNRDIAIWFTISFHTKELVASWPTGP